MFGRTTMTQWAGCCFVSSCVAFMAGCGASDGSTTTSASGASGSVTTAKTPPASPATTQARLIEASKETIEKTGIYAWKLQAGARGHAFTGLDKSGKALFRQAITHGRVGYTVMDRAAGSPRRIVTVDDRGTVKKVQGSESVFMQNATARLSADLQPIVQGDTSNFDAVQDCLKELLADAACAAAWATCVTGTSRGASCVVLPLACVYAGYNAGVDGTSCFASQTGGDPGGDGAGGAGGTGGAEGTSGNDGSGDSTSGGCDIDQCCGDTATTCCDDPNGCC